MAMIKRDDFARLLVPMSDAELDAVLQALMMAEDKYLDRAVRYKDKGLVNCFDDYMERASFASRLHRWIAYSVDELRSFEEDQRV